MNKTRPINLDLTTMVFPPMAVASILHRVSGVILFLMMPWLLYLLALSLHDVTSFTELQLWLVNPYCKLGLWVTASAAWYHLIAGIRHLATDADIGDSLQAGRYSAIAIIIMGIIGTFVLGIWIW